jgi:hypothetical protein
MTAMSCLDFRNPSYGETWPKCQWLQQELKNFLETLPSTASASDLHAGFLDAGGWWKVWVVWGLAFLGWARNGAPLVADAKSDMTMLICRNDVGTSKPIGSMYGKYIYMLTLGVY